MRCPVCGRPLKTEYVRKRLPHFGDALIITVFCDNCGYKNSGVIYLESRGPRVLEIMVSEENLGKIIVVGPRASLEIPELEIRRDPGPFSEGEVTTVEGIINRFLRWLSVFERGFPEEREKLERIRRALREVSRGEREVVLRIEDPDGLSKFLEEVREDPV